MWTGNNNNNSVRKSYPNLINSTELYPLASPMATITDIDPEGGAGGLAHNQGVISRSGIKNLSNTHTLSSG